jgi:hypothetical protein
MKKATLIFATLLIAAVMSIFTACTKPTEEVIPTEPITQNPTYPEASRLRIHFGTSTYMGCMYTFRNCILIDLFGPPTNFDGIVALPVKDGEAQQTFGQYFPLTADFVLEASYAAELKVEPQTFRAGWYPLVDSPTGMLLLLDPSRRVEAGAPGQTQNTYNHVGELHNYLVQEMFRPESQEKLANLKNDLKARNRWILEQMTALTADAGFTVGAAEAAAIQAYCDKGFTADYGDYRGQLAASTMDANDQAILVKAFAAAEEVAQSQLPFGAVMSRVSEISRQLSLNPDLKDAPRAQSSFAILEHSLYYWKWREQSFGNTGGTANAAKVPDWVWADAIAGAWFGPIAGAAASTAVYLDQR